MSRESNDAFEAYAAREGYRPGTWNYIRAQRAWQAAIAWALTHGVDGPPAAQQLLAIGEVNCFDSKGWPIIRRYPSSARAPSGAQVFILTDGVAVPRGDTFPGEPPAKE